MTFYNRKEEVIEVQLTQHGKVLLSQGRFKPHSYSFYDDDILYDVVYATASVPRQGPKMYELQNAAEARIQETPRPHLQYTFVGAETNFSQYKLDESYTMFNGKMLPPTYNPKSLPAPVPFVHAGNTVHALVSPLGNSSLSTASAPALSVHFLKGHITSSLDYLEYVGPGATPVSQQEGPTTQQKRLIHIPQISCSMDYKVKSGVDPDFDPEMMTSGFFQDPEEMSKVNFSDGTFIEVEEDFLLLEITEENVDFSKENFEIQVFEIEEIKITGEEILKPLSFAKNLFGAGYAGIGGLPQVNYELINPSYSDYYFHVFVDEEINPEIFCEFKRKQTSKNMYVDRIFDCPEEGVAPVDQYGDLADDPQCPDPSVDTTNLGDLLPPPPKIPKAEVLQKTKGTTFYGDEG